MGGTVIHRLRRRTETLSTECVRGLVHRLALWLTHLMADDSRQVQRISDMRRLHFTYDKIKKGLRDGSLTRVRHGAVVDGPIQQTARARQLELIDATVPVLAGPRWR